MILAQNAQKKGNGQDTLRFVKRVIDLDSENPEIYRQSAILLSGAGLNERATETGNLESAVEGLQKTVKMDPKFMRAWYNLSLALQRLGRYQEAQHAMTQVRVLQNAAQ